MVGEKSTTKSYEKKNRNYYKRKRNYFRMTVKVFHIICVSRSVSEENELLDRYSYIRPRTTTLSLQK